LQPNFEAVDSSLTDQQKSPTTSIGYPAMSPININRLCARIDALGEIGRVVGTRGVCRLAFSDEDRLARDHIVNEMGRLGLSVTVDGIGNIFGKRAGQTESPLVMTGSHIDSVRTGGRYDGTLGVLAGLEVVERLNELGITTKRPLVVAVFANEEGARFQPDMMGSLVFQGDLALDRALDTVGIDGTSIRDNLAIIGVAQTARTPDKAIHAFVELHIEQGPVLERIGATIGIVEGVQGISWTEFTISGTSNHAGTTPMRMRKDAGYVASAIAVFVRQLTKEMGANQLATAGSISVFPNLVNVIPSKAVVTVDLRNTCEEELKIAERRVIAYAKDTAAFEGTTLDVRTLARFEPVSFSSHIMSRVENSAAARSFKMHRMPSGAGHDAQILARMCPSGMIFVPSVGGVSHNYSELTQPADLEAGAAVLWDVLLELLGE
jgi:beta-ureidopropionase / N-carbamoyl-L-amino-acid hydrolase